MKIFSKINNTWLLVSTSLYISFDTYAQPSFIKKVGPEALDDVGETAKTWALVFLAITMIIAAGSAAYSFMFGESDKGKQIAMNIMIGALVFSVLPGIAYGFLVLTK